MSSRLNQERERILTPQRMQYAKDEIQGLGYKITMEDGVSFRFELDGNTITVFPYSGWFSGKGLVDGRGIYNLLDQLRNKK